MSEENDEVAAKQVDEERNRKTNAKILYELMFEDMSPVQFLKAAKKAVLKAKKDVGKSRVLLIALLNWVDDNPIRFSPESCMGRLTELILRFDEEDDLESDDILTFVTIIRDFLNNISPNDITSVEAWEASANMSPNLLALFGKPASVSSINIQPSSPNWRAPSKFGLNNSSPIFVTVSAKAAANSSSSNFNSSPQATRRRVDLAKSADGGAKGVDDVSADVAEPKGSPGSAFPHRSHTSESKDLKDDKGGDDGDSINRREEKEDKGTKEEQGEEEEEEEESDYDDDDEEEEEDDDAGMPKITMSLNLMRALGLDTTGMEVETDWKPPEQTGIDANPDSYKL